jgi:hypothetical protein
VKKLRWESPRPVPTHPYRDTAILYAVIADIVIGVAALTGGDLRRAVIIAVALFFSATGYSWWRWNQRIRQGGQE